MLPSWSEVLFWKVLLWTIAKPVPSINKAPPKQSRSLSQPVAWLDVKSELLMEILLLISEKMAPPIFALFPSNWQLLMVTLLEVTIIAPPTEVTNDSE